MVNNGSLAIDACLTALRHGLSTYAGYQCDFASLLNISGSKLILATTNISITTRCSSWYHNLAAISDDPLLNPTPYINFACNLSASSKWRQTDAKLQGLVFGCPIPADSPEPRSPSSMALAAFEFLVTQPQERCPLEGSRLTVLENIHRFEGYWVSQWLNERDPDPESPILNQIYYGNLVDVSQYTMYLILTPKGPLALPPFTPRATDGNAEDLARKGS